jgi:hypothetical protein
MVRLRTAYGRLFAMMYDVSGQNSNTLVMRLTNDWIYLTGRMGLTRSDPELQRLAHDFRRKPLSRKSGLF